MSSILRPADSFEIVMILIFGKKSRKINIWVKMFLVDELSWFCILNRIKKPDVLQKASLKYPVLSDEQNLMQIAFVVYLRIVIQQ